MPIASPTMARPGSRYDARGKPNVHNQDVFNLDTSHEAALSAPADLSGLSDDELTGLIYAALCVRQAGRTLTDCLPYPVDRGAAWDLLARLEAERVARSSAAALRRAA